MTKYVSKSFFFFFHKYTFKLDVVGGTSAVGKITGLQYCVDIPSQFLNFMSGYLNLNSAVVFS